MIYRNILRSRRQTSRSAFSGVNPEITIGRNVYVFYSTEENTIDREITIGNIETKLFVSRPIFEREVPPFARNRPNMLADSLSFYNPISLSRDFLQNPITPKYDVAFNIINVLAKRLANTDLNNLEACQEIVADEINKCIEDSIGYPMVEKGFALAILGEIAKAVHMQYTRPLGRAIYFRDVLSFSCRSLENVELPSATELGLQLDI
jgi:hypothetical protein